MSSHLERRYRRGLRLLPGYYRQRWEEDMVAAFLDSWLTGDQDDDEAIVEFCKPSWSEVASVAGLATRLYLGGASTPRRYFAWGQAVRCAVLAVLLVHAVRGLNALLVLAWSSRLFRLPAPPTSLMTVSPGGVWPTAYYVVNVAWIVIFVTLVLGHYRTARVIAVLAIVPDLVALLQGEFPGGVPSALGPWAFWVLLDLAPVLAMIAFHRDAPPPARWPCPPTTSWWSCRCWWCRRPATWPGCRTFPGFAASWSPSPASRLRPGPAGPTARACGRWPWSCWPPSPGRTGSSRSAATCTTRT